MRTANKILAVIWSVICGVELFASGLVAFAQGNDPKFVDLEIPEFNSTDNLRGKLLNVPDPSLVKIATYIYLEGGINWFSKPTFAAACTPLDPDGTFEVDITTGGCDEKATRIALAALPSDATCHLASADVLLPSELETDALALLVLERYGPFVEFSGHKWNLKELGDCRGDPGQNFFSSSPENVRVEADGLHLAIREVNGRWQVPEAILDEQLGHGEYRVQLTVDADRLDPCAVFGAFTWDSDAPPNFAELDFEISRFCDAPDSNTGQFVVQPFNVPGNIARFPINQSNGNLDLTYIMDWRPDMVNFQLFKGRHDGTPPSGEMIAEWMHPSPPPAGNERFRLNFWLFGTTPPADGEPQEILITKFTGPPETKGSVTLKFLGGVQMIETVPSETTVDTLTVPSNVNLLVTDLIISNPNATPSCCAQIFGDDTPVTGPIIVPANETVTMNFLTGIGFRSGQVVSVRNGDNAGVLHFTIRGYRFTTQ